MSTTENDFIAKIQQKIAFHQGKIVTLQTALDTIMDLATEPDYPAPAAPAPAPNTDFVLVPENGNGDGAGQAEPTGPAADAFNDRVPDIEPNGFDRGRARKRVRGWGISYPLPRTYGSNPTSFYRQALHSSIQHHPEYKNWVRKVGRKLEDDRSEAGFREACDGVGIDYDGIVADAKALWHEIYDHGFRGIDWTDA